MKFGVFYEHQLPRPWGAQDEHRLYREALEQVELADRIGIEYLWAVEHHFLEEYSHCSAPEVFLAACAARTRQIRLGHGIRQVIPVYNHPARTAEVIATLDLVSDGRVEFGAGESSSVMEQGGFGLAPELKHRAFLESLEEICNMLAMDPYPGFSGEFFSMPCRNVVPKPVQKPHPPLWMACSRREAIVDAAEAGLGALCFAFADAAEAKHWVDEYYEVIRSDRCVPIGHAPNPSIAMVTTLSLHPDPEEAVRRGKSGFDFFRYALAHFYAFGEHKPGRTDIHGAFANDEGSPIMQALKADAAPGGMGTPEDLRNHLRAFEDSGVDQVIFVQQTGNSRHDHICESLERFHAEVQGEFRERADAAEQRKRERLAPFVEAALSRKRWREQPKDEELPAYKAIPNRPLDPEGARLAAEQAAQQRKAGA